LNLEKSLLSVTVRSKSHEMSTEAILDVASMFVGGFGGTVSNGARMALDAPAAAVDGREALDIKSVATTRAATYFPEGAL
jgi:hypothetical protein